MQQESLTDLLNYQRLIANTISGVYNTSNNSKTVEKLRDELTGRIANSMERVFEDLKFTSLGDPLSNGSFYFTKGVTENFHYHNLSAGEKSAFGDFAKLMLPKTIVFCEGNSHGKSRKDYDKSIYTTIFGDTHPDTFFISGGACNDIELIEQSYGEIISKLLANTRVIKIVDRDDRSDQEVIELAKKGIKVLSKRHLESYLLDDSHIRQICAYIIK